ncbi:MAG: nucleoside triphosphate pyrophosphohydrolase [Steroidobacteraceae bacterium]|jgi:MazG family protein|nr:nucleoside triphosphate pyrophosphohydrolase [Steroidobacteraceae bacterium]
MPMQELLDIMARLRDPATGCPWDVEQTFRTVAPYTLEEAYEVVDAIERDDVGALREELGDLLLQVVFHAQMAREQGAFDFEAVVRGICDKLVRRHPHVFGGAHVADAAEQTRLWEEQKAREKAASGRAQGLLDDVPAGLPATTRAVKLARRAARIGFDWPDADGVRAKLDEELAELDAARGAGNRDEMAAELGDVLFAVANLARHLGIDPETALRGSNARFERRFRHVERRSGETGRRELESLEAYWQEAKAAERA